MPLNLLTSIESHAFDRLYAHQWRIVLDKSHSQIPSNKRKMDANTNYYFMTESGRGEGERKTETEWKKRLLFGRIIQHDHRHNCL